MQHMASVVILSLTADVLALAMLPRLFAGGADFVMLGGMLAGHDEGGGEIIVKAI